MKRKKTNGWRYTDGLYDGNASITIVIFIITVVSVSTLAGIDPAACPVRADGLTAVFSNVSYTPPPPLVPVEFSYKAPHAESVCWASEANKWKPDTCPLKGPDKNGVWHLTVSLYPGIYQYKFVLNGSEWVTDPAAAAVEDDGYTNSLVVVGTTLERVGVAAITAMKLKKRARKIMGDKAPPPGYGSLFKPVRFCVLGDSRNAPKVYRWLLEKTSAHNPRFIANTGDIVENSNNDDAWEDYLSSTAGIDVPQFVAWGNHEYRRGQWNPLLKKFADHPGNELYYAFQLENALFVFLNTELRNQKSRITGEQFDWLKRTLDGHVADHLFVFVHRPFWACPHGKHPGDCLDSRPKDLRRVVDLLKKHGITAIFGGHDHLYYRSENEGIPQIITGGAGAPLYADEDKGGYYHYIVVDVEGDRVEATTWGAAKRSQPLKVKDEFVLAEEK